jgi:hypothetical protein
VRHYDVSKDDPRYRDHGLSASNGDADCTEAPTRIPTWVLPTENTQALFADEGHGTAPDNIYARAVPTISNAELSNANKKLCTLIQVEVGFWRDLDCDNKLTKKTEKYSPLIAALKKYW